MPRLTEKDLPIYIKENSNKVLALTMKDNEIIYTHITFFQRTFIKVFQERITDLEEVFLPEIMETITEEDFLNVLETSAFTVLENLNQEVKDEN